ncbi:hypothetical protein GCM10010211_33640 [Streptomyces albospinus]|uniref:Rieske domain-containing protein n=1 Tax=Streptomyces albospinus TaxID=285515 RepID=A0ABQ2V2U8_9ACTN|nr:hypothetical protein GCM10010211_33640 [Streptomyces albospinus]
MGYAARPVAWDGDGEHAVLVRDPVADRPRAGATPVEFGDQVRQVCPYHHGRLGFAGDDRARHDITLTGRIALKSRTHNEHA